MRPPAVAGTFYPAEDAALQGMLLELTSFPPRQRRAILLVGPHAGYIYSGSVAGQLYRSVDLPDRFVILCPNHTGRGARFAIMSAGQWRTPLGTVPIDSALATRLKERCPLLEEDERAHAREHSLEVHLPFLQFLHPGFTFVPICIGAASVSELQTLGEAIADVVAGNAQQILLISSTDMTHYEPARVARQKDDKALQAILRLDGVGLYQAVERFAISMCGYAPTTAALFAAQRLGASQGELVRYANSGDVTGDYGSVVSYAGIAIW